MFFSWSTQLSTKFQLLIKTKIPTNEEVSCFKVTTDTNNHNSCMTIHILPYNFNICYRIYLKLSGINGLGMPDAIIMHQTIYISQYPLLSLFIILPLYGKTAVK